MSQYKQLPKITPISNNVLEVISSLTFTRVGRQMVLQTFNGNGWSSDYINSIKEKLKEVFQKEDEAGIVDNSVFHLAINGSKLQINNTPNFPNVPSFTSSNDTYFLAALPHTKFQTQKMFVNVMGIGLVEPIYMLLRYGGIKYSVIECPEGFSDYGIWHTKIYIDHVSIARYIAKYINLAGKDIAHSMEIDSVVEHIRILQNDFDQIYLFPECKLKKQKSYILFSQTIPQILNKLNAVAEVNHGYLVRSELSWADIYFTAFINTCNSRVPQLDMLKPYAHLRAVRSNVYSIPAVKKWRNKRS